MRTYRHFLLSCATAVTMLFLSTACSDNDSSKSKIESDRTVVMLAVNDTHANIDNFPRFAFMVDSLRAIYPELILVSAGDNQTGNPANDQYDPRGLPMIELMNELDFNLTAIGNHEFDVGQKNFAFHTQEADFDFVCSNIDAPTTYPFDIKRHKTIYTKDGLKIGVASLLQLGVNGLPDCFPDYTNGFTFYDPFQTAAKYEGMKDSCDVFVFVNHLGYDADVALAEKFPKGKLDVIIGGHSHTLLDEEEFHNGVLITQSVDKLKNTVLIKILVKPDGTVDAHMKMLPVDKSGSTNAKVQQMVDEYKNNPIMTQPIARLEAPFTEKEQLGYLMADAMRERANVDMGLMNAGGVRVSSWNMDVVTPYDVYMLDPFSNFIVTINFSGKELYDFIRAGYYESKYHWIYPSCLHIDYTVEGDELIDIKLYTPDGKPIDPDKKYSVAMNNYMISAMKIDHEDAPVNLYIPTSENLISYLKELQVVKSYQDEKRITVSDTVAR